MLMRRPPRGFGHYLRDVVYGSLDGVITTMAVVAGSAGAQIPVKVGIILGLTNLVADGISMGAGNYLGLKSELQQAAQSLTQEAPWRHGLATTAAFMMVGAVPLLGFVLSGPLGVAALPIGALLSALALLAVGAARAPFVHKSAWTSATEMLVIGLFAGMSAYGVGALAQKMLG